MAHLPYFLISLILLIHVIGSMASSRPRIYIKPIHPPPGCHSNHNHPTKVRKYYCSYQDHVINSTAKLEANNLAAEIQKYAGNADLPAADVVSELDGACSALKGDINQIGCQTIRDDYKTVLSFCRVASFYAGPYGPCYRKLRGKTSSIECVQKYFAVETTSEERCELLKDDCLHNGLVRECGRATGKSYKANLDILKSLAKCTE